MKQQPSLFDSPAEPSGAPLALQIEGSKTQLSRAQKQFNQLLRDITRLRERLAEWNAYPSRFQQLVEQQRSLLVRLREARIRLCEAFDTALLGKGLGKKLRATAHDVLEFLLRPLIEEVPDDALLAMAARHDIDVDRSGAATGSMGMIESLASEAFGAEFEAGHDASTPEELLDQLRERVAAERAARRKPRARSEKARQREAQAEQLAKDASQALREVYRKLARELHPDRIADEAERARKTGLMQEVNRAYQARDLLTLLQLQWRIEQIDPAGMAGLEDEKLARFIHTLKDQVKALRDEIEAESRPYRIGFGEPPPRDLQPRHVEREFARQRVEIEQELAMVTRDLRRYADPAELKRDLQGPLRALIDEQAFFDRLLADPQFLEGMIRR